MNKISTLSLILLIIFSCSEEVKENEEGKKENLIPLVVAAEAQNDVQAKVRPQKPAPTATLRSLRPAIQRVR